MSGKKERGRMEGQCNFWVPRIISGTTILKFCMHIHRIGTEAH